MRPRYETVEFKRGGTFGLAGTFPIPPGTWDVTANVRSADGTVIDALACAMAAMDAVDANGNTAAVSISATAAQTALWPLAVLLCDLRFHDSGGAVMPTTTFAIDVLPEITAP